MLSQAKLERSLVAMLRSPKGIRTRQEAESRWARAYDDYAMDAEDVSGDQVTRVSSNGLRSALNFDNRESASDFCRQIERGFRGYWTGAIFAVGTPPSPAAACASVGGSGVFGSEITSLVVSVLPNVMFSSLLPVVRSFTRETSADDRAKDIAAAMHRATTTAVIVLITGLDTTPGPSGPLPITNTCRIF